MNSSKQFLLLVGLVCVVVRGEMQKACDYNCCPCAHKAFDLRSVADSQCSPCSAWVNSYVTPEHQSYCTSDVCTAYSMIPNGFTRVSPEYYWQDSYGDHLVTQADNITDYRGGYNYAPYGGYHDSRNGLYGAPGAPTVFGYPEGYYGRDPYYGTMSTYPYMNPNHPVHTNPYVDDWSQRDGLGAYSSVVPHLGKTPQTAPTTGKSSHHHGESTASAEELLKAENNRLLNLLGEKDSEIIEMAKRMGEYTNK